MERISKAFKSTPGAALIPFLMAGDPDFDTSLELFRTVLKNGADLLEIGVPYSDPLADGPVIQAAALRSLNANFSFPRAFELFETLRGETDKGLIFFTYCNPVYQYGYQRFFSDARAAGADGVIIPDLPYEESDPVRRAADACNVALIPLVSPTTNEERVARVVREARGFIYCVSSLGVTGERAKMSSRVQDLVKSVHTHTPLPAAVGFGVSQPAQVKGIAEYADGVIVGSALIRRMSEVLHTTHKDDAISAVGTFTHELVESARKKAIVRFGEGVVD